MKLVIKLILPLTFVFCGILQASEIQRKSNITGVLHKVITPISAVLKVKSDEGDDVLLYVHLKALEISLHESINCLKNKRAKRCKSLTNDLEERIIGVVIEEYTEQGVNGDIIVDGKSYTTNALKTGRYKLNHEYTRRADYLYAESIGYCKMDGVWILNRNEPAVAKKCMSM